MRKVRTVRQRFGISKTRKIHNSKQTAAQIGNTHKPRLCKRHRMSTYPRKYLSRLAQRKEILLTACLDGQPCCCNAFSSRYLQSFSEASLKLSQCLSVRHALVPNAGSTKGFDFG